MYKPSVAPSYFLHSLHSSLSFHLLPLSESMGSKEIHEPSSVYRAISSKSIVTIEHSSKTTEVNNKYMFWSSKPIGWPDEASDAEHSEILRDGVERKRKGKLLVLDLNGILADVVPVVPQGYKPDRKLKKKSVFKRPCYQDFLKFCFANFDVGVWSSKTKKNVDKLVNCLMHDMRDQLLFCWDISHCTETGFCTLENRHKPLVLKELRKLWEKQEPGLPWENGEYNESNTVLLDDSPYKALHNPPHTGIFPNSFSLYDQNDYSLGPGGDLRVYLEGLSVAENVQNYIEQHPFGQSRISFYEDFYHRVLTVEAERL